MQPAKKRLPFQFVLDELLAIRPDVRQVFGFTHVYLDQMLLLSLRDNPNQPRFNGVWIYTQSEYNDTSRHSRNVVFGDQRRLAMAG